MSALPRFFSDASCRAARGTIVLSTPAGVSRTGSLALSGINIKAIAEPSVPAREFPNPSLADNPGLHPTEPQLKHDHDRHSSPAKAPDDLDGVIAVAADAERRLHEAEVELKASREALARTRLQLIQSEKLSAVGRLAAGVAHEVKNPLSVLMMGMDLLCRQMGPNSTGSTGEVLKAMRHAAERAETIVRGLVNFSASADMKTNVQDLNHVVEQSLLMVKHELVAAHVELIADLQMGLPPVAMDGAKIEQVIVNVALNAIHSMAPKRRGKLFVRTRLSESDESCNPPGPRAIKVEIDDTGAGIPEEQLARVFEPFFTTKPAGQGTGLGLSVSRQIMEMHGGDLSIRNLDGGGVRVTITINA
jgi:signal transduction histidine kinase